MQRSGVEVTSLEVDGGFLRVSGTEAAVARLLAQRQAVGIRKYHTTVRDNPLTLRQWLVHQQEELADALVYCTRAIEQLDKEADDGR